jgi:hypothetical protein
MLKSRALLGAFIALSLSASGNFVQAQHHHHDSAGHLIDHFGHHIDQHGHHTGIYGVTHGWPRYSGHLGHYHHSYPLTSYPLTVMPSAVIIPYTIQPTYAGQTTVLRPPVPEPVADGGRITIVNLAESEAAVAYRLNGFAFEMQPAFAQTFENDRTWTIEFPSKGSRGTIRYRLTAGDYQFRLTDDGWDLFKRKPITDQPVAPPPPREVLPPGVTDSAKSRSAKTGSGTEHIVQKVTTASKEASG